MHSWLAALTANAPVTAGVSDHFFRKSATVAVRHTHLLVGEVRIVHKHLDFVG